MTTALMAETPRKPMTAEERKRRVRLRDDLPFYAARNLKIRTKKMDIVPLIFNMVQMYVHQRLEKQLAETGKVRALILKARQEGVSTYIGARYYHKTTHHKGVKAFIFTHEQEATDNLFDMTKRFHDNSVSHLKPHTKYSNSKELVFDILDSEYRLGTGGTKEVGRSQTVHLLHWSEVAFTPNASNHKKGLVQAVPDAPGSEIVYESTANGLDPVFHSMWKKAETGEGQYITIFLPWFWEAGYRSPVPARFEMTFEEKNLMALYDLDIEQIAWRRAKIRDDFDGNEAFFQQEYPSNSNEAFQVTGGESFIPLELVTVARKRKVEKHKWLVVGVDPAVSRKGDRNSIVFRWGYCVDRVDYHQGMDEVAIANRVREIIVHHRKYIKKVFIDSIGIGSGICAILHDWGYKDIVVRVNSALPARNPEKYKNKRAEMADDGLKWLKNSPVQIPDSDEFATDLTALRSKSNLSHQLQLESMKEFKARPDSSGRSPDGFSAWCLTFAEPIRLDPPKKKSSVDIYLAKLRTGRKRKKGFMGA